ncbi:MAG: tetratricopeptide repeat protein [Alphaproteobacteria bacterium]|nr:tetratricopeptide repeat protein [Alphaproteobacteria bacterium]
MMNEIDELLDRAFAAFNSEDLRAAEALCRQAMAISPHHGDALYLLGLIAYRQKAFSVAADLLHEALELYPQIVNYQLAFAEVLRAQGHLEEALSYYSKQEKNPKVKTEIGLIYLAQRKNKEAKSYFHQALKEDKDIAQAYLGLATLARSNKEKESLLLRAFATEANENTAYQLSRFYMGKKSWKKAETLIKNYLIFSRDLVVYGAVLEALGRTDEAFEALNHATQMDAFNSNAWVQTGLLLEHQKYWNKAEAAYRKALALDNTLLLAHDGLSNALIAQGQIPEALEHTRCVILENPNHFPSLYKLALLLEETADYTEALGIYFKLLILKPNKTGLEKHISHAITELAKSDTKLAKKFAKGWIKNFPNSDFAKKTWNLIKMLVVIVFCGFSCITNAFYDDDQLGLAWELRHASLGDPLSQYHVAQIWEEGKGVPQNTEKAIEFYKLAAAQGHVESNMALGRIYEDRKSMDVAMPYYLKAAKSQYVPAQLHLAEYFESIHQYDYAYMWLETAMRQLFPNQPDLNVVSPHLAELKNKLNPPQSP